MGAIVNVLFKIYEFVSYLNEDIHHILGKFIISNMLVMRKHVVLFLVEELINRVFIIFIILSNMLSVNNVRRVRRRVVDDQTYDMLFRILDQGHCMVHNIDLHVSSCDKPHFRTRKSRISTNVLGVCDRNMRFVYVLPGWEGSAADCRVLRDTILRPNGLKVPKDYKFLFLPFLIRNYYLGDNGYANSEDFLVPYRGFRYHLKEWGPSSQRPVNHQEHFNIRHTRARNVI
ncbi:hypothetical protein ACS0TY_017647 [Phlomoides rotata]